MNLTDLTPDSFAAAYEWMNSLTEIGESNSVADILLAHSGLDEATLEECAATATATSINAVLQGIGEGISVEAAIAVGVKVCYTAGALAMLKALTDLAEQDGA